jgi:hypothetical protein
MLRMKNYLRSVFGLIVVALAFTLNLPAQTIGGDTSLSSKTWTWTGLSASLAQTTLFTPTTTSDFLVTVYGSESTLNEGFNCGNTTLTWTDENGSQSTLYYLFPPTSGTAQGDTTVIHVAPNTPVTFSASVGTDACPYSFVGTYELIVSKTKLNP